MSAQTCVTLSLGILGIAYFAIMSRLLSKEDFGYFAVITAVTSILASLSEAGLGSAVIQNKKADSDYIQTAWTLSLILGIFFCLFLFGCAGWMSQIMLGSKVLETGYRIMSISLVFYAINGVGRAVIIKKLKFLQYGIYDIVAYTSSALVGIYMAYSGFGFYAVAVAMLLHQTLLGILVLLTNRKIIAIKIKRIYVQQILTFGGWLTGSVIVRNITDQLDKLITTKWIPVADLGAYNRPSGLIFQITGNINGIFDTILFPILSGINDNQERIVKAYEKSVNLIILFSLILTALLILGAEIVVSVFLGDQWLYLTDIIQIISLSVVLLSYDRLADCFFRSIGIVKSYFAVRFWVMALTCISMFIGCHYGILGLAVGMVVSRAFSNIIKIVFLSQYIKLDRIKFYKTSLLSWGVPIGIFILCYVVKQHIAWGSLFSLSLFCLMIGVVILLYPKILGEVFYENIYKVIGNKIKILKR